MKPAIAVLGKRGEVAVWQTAPAPSVVYQGAFPDAVDLRFPRASKLVLLARSGLIAVDLERSRSSTYDHPVESVEAGERYLVAGSGDGTLVVLSPSLDVLATTPACKQRLEAVAIAPKRDLIWRAPI